MFGQNLVLRCIIESNMVRVFSNSVKVPFFSVKDMSFPPLQLTKLGFVLIALKLMQNGCMQYVECKLNILHTFMSH